MIKTVSIAIESEEGKILALKRASHKRYYANKWDIISGKFEPGESAEECFYRELMEEVGIEDLLAIETKDSYIYEEGGQTWLVYPYRCKVRSDNRILLNSEHSNYQWVKLKKLLESDHATPLKQELAVWYQIKKPSRHYEPAAGE